jgi:hypothetical protein
MMSEQFEADFNKAWKNKRIVTNTSIMNVDTEKKKKAGMALQSHSFQHGLHLTDFWKKLRQCALNVLILVWNCLSCWGCWPRFARLLVHISMYHMRKLCLNVILSAQLPPSIIGANSHSTRFVAPCLCSMSTRVEISLFHPYRCS